MFRISTSKTCRLKGLVVAVLLAACSFVTPAQHISAQGELLNARPMLSELIRAELTKSKNKHSPDIKKIYENRAYMPIWRSGQQWLPRARQAFTALSSAERTGLRSHEYIDPIFTGAQPTAPGEIAKADVALTKGVMAYIKDLRFGRYKPRNDYGPKRAKRVDDTRSYLEAGLTLEEFGLWLDRIGPPTREYQTLLNALNQYEEIVANGGWPRMQAGGLLKLGVRDKRVPILRKILAIMGDFPLDDAAKQSLALMASIDTSGLEEEVGIGGQEFDKKLDLAVKRFQERHGLLVDGILGGRSQDILRVTAGERLDQIKVNLERMRWDRAHESRRYVRVNIPEFKLRAYKDREQVLEMPVVVGKDARQTPVLNDYIVNVKFNPDWTVPKSIIEKDILPKLVEDPSYVANNNLETIYDGRVVDALNLDYAFTDLAALRFRQLPGPQNPLGSFRFSLTNDQAIFLHDTPKKYLFGNTARANSSGCVRVGDARALAKFLIEDPEYTNSRINKIVETVEIKYKKLRDPVPVSLSYFTAWGDETGKVHFRRDLYGKDLELMAKMI